MSYVSVSRHNDVTIFLMQRDTAGEIIELRTMLEQDIHNIPSHSTYRAIVNTNRSVVNVQQASLILNNYAVIGKLPGHNYQIALLIHGDPATLGNDAQVNWDKGGFGWRTWAIFEGIMQTVDVVSSLSEIQQNPIITNDNVQVIYGEAQAYNWLQLPG